MRTHGGLSAMTGDPSNSAPLNVAQELGADPSMGGQPATGRLHQLTLADAVRDLTKTYPLAMLGLAFLAGAAYVSGRRRL
jgi:hypothetical protein